MNLLDILSPECIRVPLQTTDKKAVIDELVDLLQASGKVADAAAVKHAVWSREMTRTTGIGYALAIPHGKSESVNDLAIAIGLPKEPIDFQSVDDKPVKLVVLLASPLDRTTDHIQMLARISKMMAVESFREATFAASSSQELYDIIREHETESATQNG